MRTTTTPLVTPVLAAFLAASLASCKPAASATGTRSADPAAHFSAVAAHVHAGEVGAAYALFLPASFDRDLNSLLAKLLGLVGEDEHRRLCEVLAEAGAKAMKLVAEAGKDDPAIQSAVATLKDLPAVLGVNDFATFRRTTVKDLVSRIEVAFLKQMLSSQSIRESLGTTQVQVVSRAEGRARMRIAHQSGNETKTQEFDASVVDGVWVPQDLALDWPGEIRKLHGHIDALVEAKKANPNLVRDALDSVSQELDGILQFLPMALAGLKDSVVAGN